VVDPLERAKLVDKIVAVFELKISDNLVQIFILCNTKRHTKLIRIISARPDPIPKQPYKT